MTVRITRIVASAFMALAVVFTAAVPGVAAKPVAAGEAVFLVIDEDSIDNGNPPNYFSERHVNDDKAELGQRAQLRYFASNIGRVITLHSGTVGDEGWFALKTIPSSWNSSGGLRGFIGDPTRRPEDPVPHGVGAGLGGGSNPEDKLDKVPNVTPLRATGLKMLVGKKVCAVVYDSDISINYSPLNGSLKGDNLGTVAFQVRSVTRLTGYSTGSLPKISLQILDSRTVCKGPMRLFSEAPTPRSSSEPFDVDPR